MRPKREKSGFLKSFGNAARGIAVAVRNERNFRVHICMMIYVIIFSVIGKVPVGDFRNFFLCFGAVFSAELINTAIEKLCDEVTEERKESIRNIKDISAGAVLVAAVFSAVLGLCVFLSPAVFFEVLATLLENPLVAAAILLSIPVSCLFILRRKKK